MSFKDLTLKREDILECIKSFSEKGEIQKYVERSDSVKSITYTFDGEKPAMLNIYYTNDGKVTLQTNQGLNPTLSEKLANHIVENCSLKTLSHRPLRIKKVSSSEVEDLIAVITTESDSIEEKVIKNGSQWRVTGKYGDAITISWYTTELLMVQGAGYQMKGIVIEMLCTLFDKEEIIKSQLESINSDSTPAEVLEDLKETLPIGYQKLGDTLEAILSPSLAIRKVEIELTDYSIFTFPALRGLEGVIKKLFLEHGMAITSYSLDSYFEPKNSNKMAEEYVKFLNNRKLVAGIEKLYDFYKRQRHGLFHVDSAIEGSRVISDKAEAEGIIDETFNIIEDVYTSLKK